jgi:hypothetical protein
VASCFGKVATASSTLKKHFGLTLEEWTSFVRLEHLLSDTDVSGLRLTKGNGLETLSVLKYQFQLEVLT